MLAELWAEMVYGRAMTDGAVVYLPGQTGCRRVRSWRLLGDVGRVVTIGTLADGRWWVAVSWEFNGDCGHVVDGEDAAEAEARRRREQWHAHPGMWAETSAPATVSG